MKYICLFLFSLTLRFDYAQTAKIWVIDSLTHEPIEGVAMFSEMEFFYSNLNGLIQAKVNQNGLIWFKRLDYVQKWLEYDSGMDTILMVRKTSFLNEVEVSNKLTENKTVEIGYYHDGGFPKRRNICNNLCILAVYIPSYHKNVFIDKILLNIKSKKFAEDYTVYLYEPDSIGKPGKVLYKKNIIVDSLKKEGIINVRDLSIQVPNTGIFVGLENTKIYDYEHIRILGKGVRYVYTEKINADLTYVMSKDPKINPKAKNKWISFNNMPTPCFGLEVYQK